MSRLAVCAVAVLLTLAFVSGDTEGDAEWQPKTGYIKCDHEEGEELLSFLQVTDVGHAAAKAHVDVGYPGELVENVRITCIDVIDLRPALGATATLTKGGYGRSNVEFRLASPMRKGLYFSITIMGVKNA